MTARVSVGVAVAIMFVVTLVGTFTGFYFGYLLSYDYYKDTCWAAEFQKELDLPPPGDEEQWCEAQGYCGPARASLADMLNDCEQRWERLMKSQ